MTDKRNVHPVLRTNSKHHRLCNPPSNTLFAMVLSVTTHSQMISPSESSCSPFFSPLDRDQAVFSSFPFPGRGSSIVTRMQRCGGEWLKEWGLCFPLLGIEFDAFHSLGCVLLPSNTLAPHSRLDNGTPFHKYIIT